MGRKIELTIQETEILAGWIQAIGGLKGTNRLFNFALNFNFDQCKSVLKSSEDSLHKAPDEIKEYDQKLKEIAIEFSPFPKSRYANSEVPEEHIQDFDAFSREASKLKDEYREVLDEWESKREENATFKEETKVELDLYVVPSKQVPELEPRAEYWVGKFIDYSDQIKDLPDRGIEKPSKKKSKKKTKSSDTDEE